MQTPDILQRLADHARERTAEAKERVSASEIERRALSVPVAEFSFENALRKPGLSFICECKKASPSKGLISEEFPYLDIARDYEAAGADAISVLTEPKWFLGSDQYLADIADSVSVPVLRKDFTVDPYMIWEARAMGASAVLLICSVLSEDEIRDYIELCGSLGLSALVEAHNEAEIESALKAGAGIIGINNRNLKDFTVDTANSSRLRRLVPDNVVFVSESGLRNEDDILHLTEIGADAVLVGEALMKAPDRADMLRRMKEAAS